jgi:integrase
VHEEPTEEPTFHEFASEWVSRRRHEVDDRTAEHWTWALSCHLLPTFKDARLSEITPASVDRYKSGKLAEREQLTEELRRWEATDRKARGPRPAALGNGSINKTLKVLAQVLDDAIEYGHIETNPARGRKRRLKAAKPRRTWLEVDEVRALLEAAGDSRALLATMVLGGLRVGELSSLRWRAIDLARGRLTVEESKTDAGEGRVVDLSPMLLEELKLWRASSTRTEPDDLVFVTRNGTPLHRANISNRVLAAAIKRANTRLAAAGHPPIAEGVTNHSLRRTFASLLYEAGASPAYVMSQMGHASSSLALEVYARKMERQRDTGARTDALIRGAEWARMGTNGDSEVEDVAFAENENPAGAGLV